MCFGPRGLTDVTNVVTKEQRREAMAGLALHRYRVLARAHQIAHRLVGRIRNINRSEFAGACQTGQLQAVAPIGLDSIAHTSWRIGRGDHPALMTARLQHPINPETAGAGFVHEHQRPTERFEFAHRSRQGVHVATDPTLMTNFASFLGNSDVDRFLMHIHPYKQLARLGSHGLPPVCG